MRSSENIKHSFIITIFIYFFYFFHLIKMFLQALAEINYIILEALIKAMQNHVFIEDYIIVKARFKLNEFESVIKVVLSYNRDEQSRRKFKK